MRYRSKLTISVIATICSWNTTRSTKVDRINNVLLNTVNLRSAIGHESQHELMAIILLFALFASQFLILWWKKKHYKSYQAVSLGGLYLFPMLFGFYAGWSRFLVFWTLYSILNGFGNVFFFVYPEY